MLDRIEEVRRLIDDKSGRIVGLYQSLLDAQARWYGGDAEAEQQIDNLAFEIERLVEEVDALVDESRILDGTRREWSTSLTYPQQHLANLKQQLLTVADEQTSLLRSVRRRELRLADVKGHLGDLSARFLRILNAIRKAQNGAANQL